MMRSGQRGFVLIGVQVFVMIVFIALAPSYSRLHEALSAERKTINVIGGTAVQIEDVLGTAVARLQTGVPATDILNCKLIVEKKSSLKTETYVVSYEKLLVDEWRVTVTKDNNSTDPDCAVVFGGQCPAVGP